MVCWPPLCCPPATGSTLACTVWPGAPGLASTAWEMIWEGGVRWSWFKCEYRSHRPITTVALVYHTGPSYLLCRLPLSSPRHTLDNLLELLHGDGGGQALAAGLALYYQLGG